MDVFLLKFDLNNYSKSDIYLLADYLNININNFSYQDLLWLLAIEIYNRNKLKIVQIANMSASVIKFISDFYPILITSPNINKDLLIPNFNPIFMNKLNKTIEYQLKQKKLIKGMTVEQRKESDQLLKEMEEELKTFSDWNKLIELKDLIQIPGIDTKWIIKSYQNGSIRLLEDINSRLKPAIKDFNWLKKKGFIKKVKIEDLNGLTGLEDFLDKYTNELEKLHKEIITLENVKKDVDIIEKNNFTIYIPRTENASKHYGMGTKWCTAARKDCQFGKYNKQGQLYILVPKKPSYIGEKYQLHIETGTYMDEKDRPVELSSLVKKYPELKKVDKIDKFIEQRLLNLKLNGAIYQQNYNNIIELSKQGASIDDLDMNLFYDDNDDYNEQIIDFLLENGNQNILNSLLGFFITVGDLKLMQKTIDKGADPNSKLSNAINSNEIDQDLNYKMVKLLLDNGADASKNYSNILQNSSINVKLAELLLQHGADPNAFNPNDPITALNYVALNNNKKLIDLYLKYGGKIVNNTFNGVTDPKMIEYLKSIM